MTIYSLEDLKIFGDLRWPELLAASPRWPLQIVSVKFLKVFFKTKSKTTPKIKPRAAAVIIRMWFDEGRLSYVPGSGYVINYDWHENRRVGATL